MSCRSEAPSRAADQPLDQHARRRAGDPGRVLLALRCCRRTFADMFDNPYIGLLVFIAIPVVFFRGTRSDSYWRRCSPAQSAVCEPCDTGGPAERRGAAPACSSPS